MALLNQIINDCLFLFDKIKFSDAHYLWPQLLEVRDVVN